MTVPPPTALRRQVSQEPVPPKGESELAALQRELLRQEEEAEKVEKEVEGAEEKRIAIELEV